MEDTLDMEVQYSTLVTVNKGGFVQPKAMPQQLQVELREPESEGIYANLAIISHSPSEMILDFARVMPGVQKARVLSRIIMTPQHAKMMHRALSDNLKKFETQFGDIKLHGEELRGPIGFASQKSTSGDDSPDTSAGS
jgi:hypothetical protein